MIILHDFLYMSKNYYLIFTLVYEFSEGLSYSTRTHIERFVAVINFLHCN